MDPRLCIIHALLFRMDIWSYKNEINAWIMNKKGSREGHLKKKGNYVEQVRNQDFMWGEGC